MAASMHDVIVVGAGPVGASLALALADADLDIVVLDARPEPGTGSSDRSLALSHGARLIFERLQVWAELACTPGAVTPITDIDISQAGGFGTAGLHARDHHLPALGYVVSYSALQAALDTALTRARIPVRYGANVAHAGGTPAYACVNVVDEADPLLGRLAVIADGSGAHAAGLSRRRHDYQQAALVAKVWCSEPPRGLAYERFTPDGPMALLPEHDHYALVWTGSPAAIEALLAIDDASFLGRLAARFGGRRTGFIAVSERRSFPLALELAPSTVSTRCAAIGNAAQALHPVAGQGFNLGLRDAFELSRIVIDSPVETIGSPSMLARYARRRRPDRWAGVALTHGLLGIFSNASPWLRWPRGVALAMLDAMPPAKHVFTHAMLFGARL